LAPLQPGRPFGRHDPNDVGQIFPAGTGTPLDCHQSIPRYHPENPLGQLPAAPSTGRQLGKGPITEAMLQDLIADDSEDR
jgi:hypothetical protein